jgi:hypothetical protein
MSSHKTDTVPKRYGIKLLTYVRLWALIEAKYAMFSSRAAVLNFMSVLNYSGPEITSLYRRLATMGVYTLPEEAPGLRKEQRI